VTQKNKSRFTFISFSISPDSTTHLFVTLIGITLAIFIFSKVNNNKREIALSNSYSTLLKSVSQGGYSQFQADKNDLKQQVITVLNQPKNEEEEAFAAGIALYLFPEVLPDSNFEKETAMEFWAPLEKEIEQRPRTPEARMKFEEMKSNIWSYENPKITSAGLSLQAEETLKIYHELSSP